jgi:hypothetical protein
MIAKTFFLKRNFLELGKKYFLCMKTLFMQQICDFECDKRLFKLETNKNFCKKLSCKKKFQTSKNCFFSKKNVFLWKNMFVSEFTFVFSKKENVFLGNKFCFA